MKPLFPLYWVFFGLLVSGIFIVYATTRETIVGADSAAFLGYSCGFPPVGKDSSAIGTAAFGLPFSTWFFSILPCNQLFFKALACFNLLICLLILAKTGELFDSKHGWLLGLFVFLNGLFLPFMLDLEEEQLSFPFLFAASYFLLKHIKEKKTMRPAFLDKDLFIGIFFVIIAGFFWKGAIFYVPLFGLYSLPILAGFVIVLPFVGLMMFGAVFAGVSELYAGIFENKLVMQEAMLGIGVIQQFFLLVGLLNRNKMLLIAIIYTLLLAFMALRFAMLPVVFLGVALVMYLKQKPDLRPMFVFLSIGFLLFCCWNLQNAFPKDETIRAIKEGVSLARGEQVCNPFGLGWWIKLYGGKTEYYSGFPDCNVSEWKGVSIDFNSARIVG